MTVHLLSNTLIIFTRNSQYIYIYPYVQQHEHCISLLNIIIVISIPHYKYSIVNSIPQYQYTIVNSITQYQYTTVSVCHSIQYTTAYSIPHQIVYYSKQYTTTYSIPQYTVYPPVYSIP